MIVRQLDEDGDWTFGKGKNDYLRNNNAITQNVSTRLSSFLGDCPYDLASGIDWFNALGAKDQTALNLAISAVILNTPNVTGILQLFVFVDVVRNLTVRYRAQTTYSTVSGTFTYSLNGIG